MRLSTVLDSIISRDPALQYGLHHRLINLSELARFLEPAIHSRIEGTSHAAILMALSRYQRVLPKKLKRRDEAFRFSTIRHEKELVLFTIAKSVRTKRLLREALEVLHGAGGYVTVTEGDTEIVLVSPGKHSGRMARLFSLPPQRPVDALVLKFNRRYISRPGFLYMVLQQLALQQVNVVELASTETEFILFLDPHDVDVAVAALSKRFGGRRI